MNFTEPYMTNTTDTPACSWASDYDSDVGKCVRWIFMVPGWDIKWILYSVFFVPLFIKYGFGFAHDLHRHVQAYNMSSEEKKSKIRKPRYHAISWAFGGMAVGAFAMGISCIDGWGFFGIHSLLSFLSIYPVGYSAIPCGAVIMPSIHLLNDAAFSGKKLSLLNPKYSLVCIFIMALAALYSYGGFPAFGWVLADKFSKDQSSSLGQKGNYLVYAMYTLCCGCLIGGAIPAVAEMWRRAELSGEPRAYAMCRRAQQWVGRSLVACIFMLVHIIVRDVYSKDKGIFDTMELHTWCRLVELFLLDNTAQYLGALYYERAPYQIWVNTIKGVREDTLIDNSRPSRSTRKSARSRSATEHATDGMVSLKPYVRKENRAEVESSEV